MMIVPRRAVSSGRPRRFSFSRVARTRDLSTYDERTAGYVGCKRELGAVDLRGNSSGCSIERTDKSTSRTGQYR